MKVPSSEDTHESAVPQSLREIYAITSRNHRKRTMSQNEEGKKKKKKKKKTKSSSGSTQLNPTIAPFVPFDYEAHTGIFMKPPITASEQLQVFDPYRDEPNDRADFKKSKGLRANLKSKRGITSFTYTKK